jgi:DNA polymerase I-like protein with 3'-5' exonuclease and polymerase domains
VFIDYVLEKQSIHTANNSPLVVFVKNTKSDTTYVINLGHNDLSSVKLDYKKVIELILKTVSTAFVVNKKRFINLFKDKNVKDVLIADFQSGYEIPEPEHFDTAAHQLFHRKFSENYADINRIIPMSKHVERFENVYKFFKESIDDFSEDESFVQLNGIITETLSEVECNGMHIDVELFNKYFAGRGITESNPMVYSEYNLFTSTGRPSNRFAKVNYAALNKENGSRSAFTSRFGNDGVLFGVDYRAYHPHIVANLINFKLSLDVDIYEFFGKSYFNKQSLTEEDIKKSKNLTFQNFYGGIRPEYLSIEFFKKTNDYINHRWDFFERNGYVETPVFKRRITENHISEPNPNKLFNYLLQAAETEFSIQSIGRVNDFLRKRKSKVILYTYDSILVDMFKPESEQEIQEIAKIMVDNQFPVKVYVGNNYNDLCEIKPTI